VSNNVYAQHADDIAKSHVRAKVRELVEQWSHLGPSECLEQVEAHIESDGIGFTRELEHYANELIGW
jgi:hypothetical protein